MQIKRCAVRKTRRGTPCRRVPILNGRCPNHGGKSPMWFAHPKYKHGRYSKYSGIPKREKARRERRKMLKKRIRAAEKAIKNFIKVKGREPTEEEVYDIFLMTKV